MEITRLRAVVPVFVDPVDDGLMPRRHGLESSEVFHVFNRGADRQDIFSADSDQRVFEAMLADLVATVGVAIYAYSLMTNHFHLVIRASGKQLSEAMYVLGRRYAVWFNHVAGRSGPLFDSRFRSVPITTDEMLMVEGRYVHRNPIDIVGSAALAAYRFSSLPVFVGRRPAPDWLTTAAIASPFASGDEYLKFVLKRHVSDTQYAGDRPPLRRIDVDDLDVAIAQVAGIDVSDLYVPTPGRRNDARTLAAVLGTELRVSTRPEFERYGYESAQAFRNASSRGRSRIRRDPQFERFKQRVLAVVAA
jgi:REP-associated tyrosine transposase